jgi:tetratricopeptide (TPR) repeat protein
MGQTQVSEFIRTQLNPSAVTPTRCLINNTILALSAEAFACHSDGKLTQAIALYERILSFKNLPVIHNNLGQALTEIGDLNGAAAEFSQALTLRPDDAEALTNWGVVLHKLDHRVEAELKFREAIAVNPQFAHAYYNLAIVLKETGRIREARRAVQQAIRLAPRNTIYYELLAEMRRFKAGDRYMLALQNLSDSDAAPNAMERINLHFALAKAYEDTHQFKLAFVQFLAGNRLQRGQTDYDEAATLGRIERIRNKFNSDFMQARAGCGNPSSLPIFIIGMPRSGTTLIEQILASHPAIFGAGELKTFAQIANAELNPALSELGGRYVAELRAHAPHASRIVDKMPANFLLAGLIHLVLPNATIIHAVRNPIDTCVSCFTTHFVDQPFTHDLAELGRYYHGYHALMTHWRGVLPPQRFLEVRYEELIDDLETVARRMVIHCGLPWDMRCLEFYRTNRMVRTASASQVRQPIYRSSVGRWRQYEAHLGPLLTELPSAA